MPHCCAVNCSNQPSQNSNTSYHRLPKDEALAKVWKNKINRTQLPNQVYLCSEHFEESCFDKSWDIKQSLMSPGSKKSRKLLKGSVPTIFPHKQVNVRASSENRSSKKQQKEVT